MKILIIGGGPGGLYSGFLLKKADPTHEITLLERNPPDATYGWGVVFSERTLSTFQEVDSETYQDITKHFVRWDAIDVQYHDHTIRSGGHVFAGISRKLLLNILQKHCREVGVRMKFGVEVSDLSDFGDFDLIIAADGVNSFVRKTYESIFQPSVTLENAKFIWFGTDKVFDAFTFLFCENEHGLFQAHCYPFDSNTGTCIVECEQATCQRAGLEKASEAESIAYCEKLFAQALGGHRLLSNKSSWINFPTVRNKTWRHRNIVLLGDAVHTAHFSIGSGTKLAMEDAIALVRALQRHRDVETALTDYEIERKPVTETIQNAAQQSLTYFENVKRYFHLEPMQFVFHLLTRSERVSYENLRLRDSRYADAIDRWFMGSAVGTSKNGDRAGDAPRPMGNAFPLRGVKLANRVVWAPTAPYSAREGMPNDRHQARLGERWLREVGLVMTEPAAVSPEGRITPGCAGIYRAEHVAAWARIVASIHDSSLSQSPTKIAIQLAHSGRRGSTRPRWEGLDRPLRDGNWPLFSASPLPYTPLSQLPKEMDAADREKVRKDFIQAAEMADQAGFDMIQLHFAHGYLLASFLSPLTNQRSDGYGGSLDNRMRFPLEVFDAVRAVWPETKPIAVAISATDWSKGGTELQDAVVIARMLQARGCDLVTVLAGQTTIQAEPAYGPCFLTRFSDRVRNEARIATMVAGHITTADQINTILAAGRADLCIIDPPGDPPGNPPSDPPSDPPS
ncbi:MAG: FAD-dependent monooxygenase [Acidobacteria bacterium]|nr:FAD-dependent monooxygenase [Acidobacteriota bacterium]